MIHLTAKITVISDIQNPAAPKDSTDRYVSGSLNRCHDETAS